MKTTLTIGTDASSLSGTVDTSKWQQMTIDRILTEMYRKPNEVNANDDKC